MLINSALLVSLRSFTSALLALVKWKYLIGYLLADLAIYFAQSYARGDYECWLPVYGKTGIVISFLLRAGAKAVSDYTGVIQFRHPSMLGGVYWTWSMILGLVSSYLATYLYFDNVAASEVTLDESLAWKAVMALSGGWVFTFGVILLLMKRKYIVTFFSLKTGKQNSIDRFKSKDDAIKATIINRNRNHWKTIENDVKIWVQENWDRWEIEKPPFFNDVWKSKLDISWLSTAELKRQNVSGSRVSVRRGSMLGVMAEHEKEKFLVGLRGRRGSSRSRIYVEPSNSSPSETETMSEGKSQGGA
jgi:hypothetical protein